MPEDEKARAPPSDSAIDSAAELEPRSAGRGRGQHRDAGARHREAHPSSGYDVRRHRDRRMGVEGHAERQAAGAGGDQHTSPAQREGVGGAISEARLQLAGKRPGDTDSAQREACSRSTLAPHVLQHEDHVGLCAAERGSKHASCADDGG
ncbi:hypothetical protein GCM10023339_46550 [Alloalcanivorax gelatiniphagus]